MPNFCQFCSWFWWVWQWQDLVKNPYFHWMHAWFHVQFDQKILDGLYRGCGVVDRKPEKTHVGSELPITWNKFNVNLPNFIELVEALEREKRKWKIQYYCYEKVSCDLNFPLYYIVNYAWKVVVNVVILIEIFWCFSSFSINK